MSFTTLEQVTPQRGRGLTGILDETQIWTAQGLCPAGTLRPGDRVVTRSGIMAVLAVEERRMAQAPVLRLTQGGIAPDQPVWQAGAPCPARVLDDRLAKGVEPAARLIELRFARDAVIYAEGVEVFCPA